MDSNDKYPKERFQLLISKLLDESCTQSELDELMSIVSSSEEAQAKWQQNLETHADLGYLINPPRQFSPNELLRVEETIIEQSLAQDELEIVDSSDRTHQPTAVNASRYLIGLLALAAGVLIMIAFPQQPDVDRAMQSSNSPTSSTTGPAIAVVTSAVGHDLGNEILKDSKFRAGSFFEFARGLVELRINEGVTLVAQGPARFHLVSKDEVRLDFGKVTATVDKGFEGFQLITKEAVFTDLGTSFAVNADSNGNATLNVHSGEVEVQPTTDNAEKRRFFEGNAVKVTSKNSLKPYIDIETEIFRPLDSLAFPHESIVCSEDTYVIGGKHSQVIRSNKEDFWVKLDLVDSHYCRRGLLGFDLSHLPLDRLAGARLVMTVVPNDYASEIEPSNVSTDTDWKFRVYGVWDDNTPKWNSKKVNWETAPGAKHFDSHGRPKGPWGASSLGSFVIQGKGIKGNQVFVESSDLLDYLTYDNDGWITLSINRVSGLSSDPSEDRVVHGFASREHPTLPAPTLELWFDEMPSKTPEIATNKD